jgi:hypothetical protein
VLIQKVDGVWVEDNQMSGGGRIKVGGHSLGRNMYIRDNVLDFVNDNAITIVDTVVGVTEHVEITGNTITNPVASGIFFGADGESFLGVPDMSVRDVTIALNRITGFFAAAGIIGDLPESAADIRIVDNVIQAQRATEIQIGYQYVAGILLKRAANAPTAAGIRVEGNSIVASGPHAVFNVAAIAFFGSLSDLSIARNTVLCDRCGMIGFGIWLRYGAFENVALSDNMVNGAGVALFLGFEQETPGFTLAIGSIHNNQFLGSRNVNAGQVTIDSSPGETIAAQIAGNYIQGGVGYGMLCSGGGMILLTDLVANNFAGNARGDLSGCS